MSERERALEDLYLLCLALRNEERLLPTEIVKQIEEIGKCDLPAKYYARRKPNDDGNDRLIKYNVTERPIWYEGAWCPRDWAVLLGAIIAFPLLFAIILIL